ncbi:MAG TPA: lipopolysaccharide heptosyltransferase II [Vicinamibacterales bacterium]|nr:lipopolysaccharide heptosyltransferase II [Vicinamibacterales bacterium]
MEQLVIVAPNWLGDAVMALPAIADVSTAQSGGTVAVAARAPVAPLFSLVPGVSRVVTLPRGSSWPLGGCGTAILLPNSFHSAMSAARAGVRERWGYRTDWRGVLLTRAVDRPGEAMHQIDYYRHLVSSLGFPNGSPAPRLEIADDVRGAGRALLERAGWNGRAPLVAIAPGAAYGSAKRWPAAAFADLAAGLAEDGVATVIVGANADRAAAASVVQELRGRTTLIDVVGRTDIPTLAGALSNCRAVMANDSGAMHLAAALGVHVVAAFGPTDERLSAPRTSHPEHRTILTSPTWCRPCGLRECPLDHMCMRGISPGDALAATRSLL